MKRRHPRSSGNVFMKVLRATATLARSRGIKYAVPSIMWVAGRLVHRARRMPNTRLDSAHDAALAWQKAFPSPKAVPIVRADHDETHARILTECPLRGTHDRSACERLMDFDRGVLAPMGAKLVVLESQADGHASCLVAIRRQRSNHDKGSTQ